MAGNQGGKNRVDLAERRRRALALRRAGAGYRAIAGHLGYANASGAYKAVSAALAAVVRAPAEELLGLELDRLDALQRAIWPLAVRGNLRAVDRALALMARRARLLGLDAPKRHEDVTDYQVAAARVAAELGKPELAGAIARDMVLRHEALREGRR